MTFTKGEIEIIEWMKKNERIWLYNTDEEKAIFDKVGKENCIAITDRGEKSDRLFAGTPFEVGCCYQIKSDFQPSPPEPEYESIIITTRGAILGIWQNKIDYGSSKITEQEMVEILNEKKRKLR